MEKRKVKTKEKVETLTGVQVGIKAPRGAKITCKTWQTEAALRMLMNNLDPEVAEKPSELIVYGGSGKAARNWEAYHRVSQLPEKSGKGRDAPCPVRQACRDLQDPRGCAPRLDLECHARSPLGQLGEIQRAGRAGTHHVRPDDGRELDLHRNPGNSSGDVSRPLPLRRRNISEDRSKGGWSSRQGWEEWEERSLWPPR